MTDLNDLMVFATVVERGSFTQAAEALNTPKSNISRKITRLESQLGVRLLERSTRKLHLTEIGQRYYQYCKRIKEEYEAAGSAVESMLEKPQGRLRVCTSLGVGQSLLGDHLAEYCRHYPDVELDLSLTNRRVDLIEEGYDLAFRVGELPDSGLIAKKLCSINLRLYAAPSFAKHRINTPSDLLKHPLMLMSAKERSPDWHLHCGVDKTALRFEPNVRCDDFSMLMRMAIKGLGITELPEYMAKRELAEGTLINILPDWQFEPVDLYALYPSHRGSTPKVRALLTHLSQALPH
ncbi:LysR family transcriptional regulator [Vibrio coralliilyticus]|uniref:LysR family transcriptional regulator n=1 Tax=Vibrio coralliilyticus TaxID=190893 RepID=UPI0006CC76FA|nr:LysR family transcriptional regulator [Vibrio coralliilyticus]AXN30856.1 LysR family transcriptional regulator [Vibrio coralliilyticus]KPH27236.1 LysR family transcriptional regulator [Vibrio coralliilyticus]